MMCLRCAMLFFAIEMAVLTKPTRRNHEYDNCLIADIAHTIHATAHLENTVTTGGFS